jgi:hypothetical protein
VVLQGWWGARSSVERVLVGDRWTRESFCQFTSARIVASVVALTRSSLLVTLGSEDTRMCSCLGREARLGVEA